MRTQKSRGLGRKLQGIRGWPVAVVGIAVVIVIYTIINVLV